MRRNWQGTWHRADFVFMIAAIVAATALAGCANKTKSMRYFDTYDQLSRQDVEGDSRKSLPPLPAEVSTPEENEEDVTRNSELEGDRYLAKGELPMAYVKYEKAIKGDPENARLYYKRGLTLLLGRVEDKAIESFNKVLTLNPKYALAYSGLGQAYFQKKNYVEARKYLQQAVKLDDRLWRSHLILGVLYDYDGQYGQAVHEYLLATQIKKDEGSLYNNLGVSYTMAGHFDKAVAAFQTAIKKGYTQDRVYNNMGVALSKAGRYKEAMAAFSKGGDAAQAYNNLGCIYMAEGDVENARRCFRMAIHMKPTFYARADENLKNLENSAEVQ